jgi:hypothetical protein
VEAIIAPKLALALINTNLYHGAKDKGDNYLECIL